MSYATLEDIAKKAKKSVATVSRVLNGKARQGIPISESTIEQIMGIARELNYRPNFLAKNLVERDSRVVGLVVPDIMQSFFNEICYHLSQELSEAGYDLILCHSYEDAGLEQHSIEMLLSRRVSGILLAPVAGRKNAKALQDIQRRKIPLILIDRYYGAGDFCSIVTEDVEGFYSLTEHLVKQGARRILFIAGNRETSVSIERRQGYARALTDYGIELREDLIRESGFFMEDGYAITRECIKKGTARELEAIAAVNDAVALGVLRALEEGGVRVPEDMLVGGYANDRYSDYFKVPLTTVDQPKQSIAHESFAMLMRLIRGEELPERSVRIPCNLVVRRSTMSVKGARDGQVHDRP